MKTQGSNPKRAFAMKIQLEQEANLTAVAPGTAPKNDFLSTKFKAILQAELKARGVSLCCLLIYVPLWTISYYTVFTVPIHGQTLSDLDAWTRFRASAILQITHNLPCYLFPAAIVGIMGGLGLKALLIALGFWLISSAVNMTAALVPLPWWVPTLLFNNANWVISMFFLFYMWHRARQSQIAPVDQVAQLRRASVWWILAVFIFDAIVAILITTLALISLPSFPYWSSVLFSVSAYIGREVALKFRGNPYAEFVVTLSTGMACIFSRLSVTQFVGIGRLVLWEFYLSGISLVIRISLAMRQRWMREQLTLPEKQIIAMVIQMEDIFEVFFTIFYYIGCGIATGTGGTMAAMICFSFVLQFVTSVAVSFILMKYQQVNVVEASDKVSVERGVLYVISILFGLMFFSPTSYQFWTGIEVGGAYAVRNVTQS